MKKRKRSLPFILATVLLAVTLSGILLIIGAYFFVRRNIDYSRDEIMFSSLQGGSGTKFYYNEGEDYTEYIPRELCVYSVGGLKQNWVSYADISENIKIAFISAEDRKFFEHRGVDFKRTALAFFNYIFKTKPKFGGSTITQQVIKNASGDNDNTVYRKISEILRALHIEDIHSKEEIFELYMNIVPMGDGIIGVGMASEYYFGKSADDLSIEEAATIVGITNAPSKYNPYRNPELCMRKRNNVLYAMLECGHFDYEEYERL